MSYYNTYRPQTFDEIDNEQVKSLITSLLSKKKEQLPHAYFLTGPRGIGKTTAARIIAKLFNCIHPKKSGEPCGTCDLCLQISQGTALDVFEMDAASNTGVDNIRDLKDKIILAPAIAKWKIYIIDEVHMLSTGAFNALLKTLEEPPKNTVFILATTDPQKVPQTIQSRCLYLQFKKPDTKEIISALSRIIAVEKIRIDTDSLNLMAEAADGSFRDATKLLEQASLTTKEITETMIRDILSLPQEQSVINFIDLLIKKDVSALIIHIEKLTKEGTDIKQLYLSVLKALQRILVTTVTGEKMSTVNVSDVQQALNILLNSYNLIKGNALPDLALELAVLEYCSQHNAPSNTNTRVSIPVPVAKPTTNPLPTGNITIDKLKEHWTDIISELKTVNHSASGVLRSTRPKSFENGIVTIEAFYTFHKDKLSETKTKEAMVETIKKLFGENVKIDVVLGKK